MDRFFLTVFAVVKYYWGSQCSTHSCSLHVILWLCVVTTKKRRLKRGRQWMRPTPERHLVVKEFWSSWKGHRFVMVWCCTLSRTEDVALLSTLPHVLWKMPEGSVASQSSSLPANKQDLARHECRETSEKSRWTANTYCSYSLAKLVLQLWL